MVLQGVILHKTDKSSIKNKNFLNVLSFSKKIDFSNIRLRYMSYRYPSVYTSYNFEIDFLENDITMTFRFFEIVNVFLNRQFLIFL